MFWMTSKVFQDEFLTNEDDDVILDSQYVIVSTRIRARRDKKVTNVVLGKAMLFPDARVCGATTKEEMKERYYEMCEQPTTVAFLATLVHGAIKEGYNIIFMCTHNERKLHYLECLANFIYIKFGYPVYEYHKLENSTIIQYNKKQVLKKCNKYIKRSKKKQTESLLAAGEKGIKKVMEDYKKMSKKKLKKILEKQSLYSEGMDKEEMLDTIEVFLN